MKKLNIVEMKKASRFLLGKHDFSSFCAKDKIEKDPFRELKKIDIGRKSFEFFGYKGDLIYLRFVANSFLWKMVRFLSGTLLRVGSGKMSADEVKMILDSKDNMTAGPVAPAHGLYLTNVGY